MDVTLNLIQSVALTVLVAVLGEWCRERVWIFRRFAIPGPVIGGFGFALLVFAARSWGGVTFQMDTTLQTPAMIAFFTTVGIAASFGLLKMGGKVLMTYLVLCWGVAIFQNLIGAGLATVFGIHPLLGIMAGSTSLEGGHGNAAAFGPVAEQLGASGATTVALAAATFGLVSGSLLGGPTASFLIRRHGIAPTPRAFDVPKAELIDNESHTVSSESLLYAGALVAVIMAAGNTLGRWFTDQFGYALPAYVGAMLVAIIVRNVIDAAPGLTIRMEDMDVIGNLTLSFFLTQAMMTLKIWELADVAGPLMGILVVQVAVLLAFAVFVVFPLMGKDYDAATMVGGLMGHGLGATPNGIANMDAISKANGARSKLAFVVVPLAGSVLIDIVSVPWITFCLNFFA